ncbi:MAG TPA: helix-turn-helix domain-containing protein [Tepidiformaceae bacterium]|nr:helix-turn-helix domain-containing protein [Tepidiformaceae bacterium]
MATWDAASIAALRRQLRLSQAEFARRLGVRQQTVSEWETGRYEPRGASTRVLSYLAEETTPYDASPPREGSTE